MSPEDGIDRRRSPRIPVRRSVALSWFDGPDPRYETTQTVMVSRYGCAVTSRYNLAPDTILFVETAGKTIHGRVAYVRKNDITNQTEVAIAFDEDGREFWGGLF